MTYYYKLLLLLTVLSEAKCEEGAIEPIPHPLLPKSVDLMFLFGAVWASGLVRFFIIKHNISIPCEAFNILGGFVWGVIARHNEYARLATHVIFMQPYEVKYIYLPVLIYWIAFCIDVSLFWKTLPQIAVIGLPIGLVTAIIFGSVMRLVIDMQWSVSDGILFGVFCAAIYPNCVISILKQQSTRTKQISVLLEGEAVLSIIVADITHSLLMNNLGGYIVHWYQFVACTLRFVVIALGEGFLLGLCNRYLIRRMYTDRLSVFMLVFVAPFFVYAVAQKYLSGCGTITVAIVGAMMSGERAALAKEIDDFLMDICEVTYLAVDTAICVSLSAIFSYSIAPLMDLGGWLIVIVTYLMYYAVRFVVFLIHSPVLSRLGYGMDLKNMIVCVWGGVKSPFSLLLCRIFMAKQVRKERHLDFYFHIMSLYFLSVLINGTFMRTILDFLGLRQISVARKINMNNCVKHVLTKRDKMISVLKMDRFLCDINWSIVADSTTIKHPYQLDLDVDSENDFFVGFRYTTCPDCKRDIPHEPTARELKDMKKEAKLRVLKAKKMSYSRQFQNGMMSKEGIRILTQAVELAMDSEAAVIELEGLEKRFTDEGCFTRFVRNHVQDLNKGKKVVHKMPRKYFRRVCYNIVINDTWEKFMLGIVAVNMVFIIAELSYHSHLLINDIDNFSVNDIVDSLIIVAEIGFSSLYIAEIVMKILAYSWINVCEHGFRTYFKSPWNIIDFIITIVYTGDTIYDICHLTIQQVSKENLRFLHAMNIILCFRFVRLLRVLKMLYPKMMNYLNRNVNTQMAVTYELGKSYATGEAEILDMLPYMIDNKMIRDEVKKKSEGDRVLITKLLGTVQKEKPWIAITVKTKQAIRTILNNMNEAVDQLKNSGWVDGYELEKLHAEMAQLYKKVNALKTVQPSAPKVIFREIAWMAGDENVINFLFENVTVKKFEPGDIVFDEGTVADGIYIVVTGVFMINYVPNQNVLNSLLEYGLLPIVDYLSGSKYEETYVDYIVSGNCIGELSTLTRRSYNCRIVADTHCQVYVMSHNILRRAMELSSDPIMGLECRIWREVSIRMAVPLLLSVPAYHSFQQDQIKYTLERAFVPNLSNYKIFAVTDMIQDIILVEGVVADFNTRESFVAPFYIPRTVQKLILPTSSLMNIPIDIETKLLIIPGNDVDEYDVMMTAEETCEMISTGASAKCLQHTIQHRARKRKRTQRKLASGSSRKVAGDFSSRQSVKESASEDYKVTVIDSAQMGEYMTDEDEQEIHSDDKN